jgi:hypothetical protein
MPTDLHARPLRLALNGQAAPVKSVGMGFEPKRPALKQEKRHTQKRPQRVGIKLSPTSDHHCKRNRMHLVHTADNGTALSHGPVRNRVRIEIDLVWSW